jgi:type IV pilus assembly protein PilX
MNPRLHASHPQAIAPPAAQRGVALVVVLILLLVMTLLGLVALRNTLFEERMTANQTDRAYSFQAAEGAMRQGESQITNSFATACAPPTVDCGGGLYVVKMGSGSVEPITLPADTDPERWNTAATWTGASSQVATLNLGATPATAQPRFIIERLWNTDRADGRWANDSSGCTTSGDVSPDAACSDFSRRFRITVRSQMAGRAAVTLQSVFVAQ